MSILKNLKRKSQSAASFEEVKQQAVSYTSTKNYKDDRYWQPVVDKSNNGSAIIRFLPGILIPDVYEIGANGKPVLDEDGEKIPKFEKPFVRKWSHGFKGPTGLWYIENNLNTIDQVDPCTEYNSKLWKTEDDDLRKQVKGQKRKLSYISNIYVIKHPAKPDDEGKVFLYEYGKKVFDKIMAQMIPPADEADIEPVDVFDLWAGANFRLRIKNVENYRNYDTSTFDPPKPLFEDDKDMEQIFASEHSLLAEIAPDKFKSFDELQKRLNEVLGIKEDDEDELPTSSPRSKPASVAPKQKAAAVAEVDDEDPETHVASTSGDAKSFFDKLKAKAS